MRRQIIKTRPQQPYRVARIIIVVIIVALIGWFAVERWWLPAHAAPHASLPNATVQDSAIFARKPQVPIGLS